MYFMAALILVFSARAESCAPRYSVLLDVHEFPTAQALVGTLFPVQPQLLGPLRERKGLVFRGMILSNDGSIDQILATGMRADRTSQREVWFSRSPSHSAYYGARYSRAVKPDSPKVVSVIFVVKDPAPTQSGGNIVIERDLEPSEILGAFIFDRVAGRYVRYRR